MSLSLGTCLLWPTFSMQTSQFCFKIFFKSGKFRPTNQEYVISTHKVTRFIFLFLLGLYNRNSQEVKFSGFFHGTFKFYCSKQFYSGLGYGIVCLASCYDVAKLQQSNLAVQKGEDHLITVLSIITAIGHDLQTHQNCNARGLYACTNWKLGLEWTWLNIRSIVDCMLQ